MKVVFLSVWFSEKMGYIENCLPKAMVRLGHDVHVISSTAQVYYNSPDYDITYKPYLGNPVVESGIKEIEELKLHRLPFGTISNKIFLKGLGRKLKELHPDVVQVFDAFSFLTLQGGFYKLLYRYKFFTANHIVASVFPIARAGNRNYLARVGFFITRSIPGRIVSLLTSRCYPATPDALEIAVSFYKVPRRKVKLAPLGVDTDLFYPMDNSSQNRSLLLKLRKDLGVLENEILCLYTGRFTEGKNPFCLAKAVEILVDRGEPYKALFIGKGPQSDEIRRTRGSIVHEFVPYLELPDFYRIADIGVWPRQESTSMLDAAASGLPIIISDRVQATERVEGNGLTYIENNVNDLVRVLISMKDESVREKFSRSGIRKIKLNYSWNILAKERIDDYKVFLGK